MTRAYPAMVHKDTTSDYGVSFPDLPGCATAGTTLEEAVEQAQEALQLHIDGMLEDEASIPEPSSLADVAKRARRKRACAVIVVSAALPSRARRVNVTIDEGLLARIDAAARFHGLTRSAFLAEGARLAMASLVRPSPPATGRRKRKPAARTRAKRG